MTYSRKNILVYASRVSRDVCLGKYSADEEEFWINFLLGEYLPAKTTIECLRVFIKHNKIGWVKRFKATEYKTIQAFLARVLPKKDLIFMLGADGRVAKDIIKRKLSK